MKQYSFLAALALFSASALASTPISVPSSEGIASLFIFNKKIENVYLPQSKFTRIDKLTSDYTLSVYFTQSTTPFTMNITFEDNSIKSFLVSTDGALTSFIYPNKSARPPDVRKKDRAGALNIAVRYLRKVITGDIAGFTITKTPNAPLFVSNKVIGKLVQTYVSGVFVIEHWVYYSAKGVVDISPADFYREGVAAVGVNYDKLTTTPISVHVVRRVSQ